MIAPRTKLGREGCALDPVYLEGEVVVGSTLPEGVQFVDVPDYKYQYVYMNGLPLLVDPLATGRSCTTFDGLDLGNRRPSLAGDPHAIDGWRRGDQAPAVNSIVIESDGHASGLRSKRSDDLLPSR
jgi:hypothetical protein